MNKSAFFFTLAYLYSIYMYGALLAESLPVTPWQMFAFGQVMKNTLRDRRCDMFRDCKANATLTMLNLNSETRVRNVLESHADWFHCAFPNVCLSF